jgi:hypothetical protein
VITRPESRDRWVRQDSRSCAIRRLNIGLVVGLALLLRTLLPVLGYIYTHDVTIFHNPDTDTYVAPARELISYQRFFSNGAPEIIRTPGYPLLLTAGLLLHQLELVTILLQIVLSCFTVYTVYLIAQLLFKSESIAITAATLYALEPLSILYTSQLLTETMFTALATVWLYFLLRYLDRHLLRDLMAAGLTLAASIYVRPIGYFLPAVIAGGLAVLALVGSQRHRSRFLSHAAIFLVFSMGLIVPWQLRNRTATGYSGFSGISPVNMYFYLATSVLAVKQHARFFDLQRRLGYMNEGIYLARHPEQKSWTVAQRFEYMNREAKAILLGSPFTYVRIHFAGIVRSVFDSGATSFLIFFKLYKQGGGLFGEMHDRGIVETVVAIIVRNPLVFWSNALFLLIEMLYLSGAAVPLLSRQLMRQPMIIAATLTLVYYLVISGGPEALGRFRHPAMPIISALAGYGLWSVGERVRELKEGRSFFGGRLTAKSAA